MERILSKIRKVHLVGVGGVGMSGLARLLKNKGFIVSGSDIKESYYFRKIKTEGIKVFLGHRKENIEDADLVCFSSAVREDNVELREAKRRGLPVLERGELLAFLAQGRKTIAVSGTHGKTTTTALLAFLLDSLGYNPSVFIGGESLNYSQSSWWGGDYFIIEADESDGSFLKLSPEVAIITNIDKEHLDFYKKEENIYRNFLEFAFSAKRLTIGWGDSPQLRKILRLVKSISYGFSKSNKIRAENILLTPQGSIFDLVIGEKRYSQVFTSLLGKHNVLNTLAVLAFFYYLNENIEKVLAKLGDFRSTKRRFQIKENLGGVLFVDDYAHHPTEIRMTLATAKIFNPQRLVVIFEPHRFSRIHLLYNDFMDCFSLADVLIVTDIYSASEEKPSAFDESIFFEDLKRSFKKEFYYFSKEDISKNVISLLKEGDLLIALGAGEVNLILDEIIREFKRVRDKI